MTLATPTGYLKLVSDIQEAVRANDLSALEILVREHRKGEVAPYLLVDPRITHLVSRMRSMYDTFEPHDTFIALEAEAARLGDDSRYCYVGCGPFPQTLLGMRNKAPMAALIGIDKDVDVLGRARKFVNAAVPGSGISFWYGSGEELDYRGLTHVHIDVSVRPEFDIVRAVCETADKGVTIMLRTVEMLACLLCQPIAAETVALLVSYGFERAMVVRDGSIVCTSVYRR
jgi:hypothetical protein